MLVDIEFLLQEHLEHARGFFAAPTEANGGHVLSDAAVERMFGHAVRSEGVYYVGSPNMGNHLSEVVDQGRRYKGEWCDYRLYGTADTVEEILAYARPAELEQACVLLIVPTDHIPSKSGPWIGPLDEDENPKVGEVVLDWSLVPIDPEKLEAALAKRASSSPAP